ncbi:MAG: GNAT family N-acetyltransferase [Christensenellales bacterium]|jgi:GNAT superfamily N-acetyltransferase
MKIDIVAQPGERVRVAERILLRLPQWFGNPPATAAYIAESAGQEVLAAWPDPGDATAPDEHPTAPGDTTATRPDDATAPDEHPTAPGGAHSPDGAVGFLALQRHYPASCEIAVMGVDPAWHRRGVGRALVEAAIARCRAQGVRFLTVKTLDASHPDPGYARTRAFYAAMGFTPLERFPELWDPSQPALMLIAYLG